MGRDRSRLLARRIPRDRAINDVCIGTRGPQTAPVTDEIRSSKPLIMLHINRVMCTCFLDTGSEITLIKEIMKEKLNLCSFCLSSHTLRGASGHSLRMLQNVNLFFQFSEQITCNHAVDIVSENVFREIYYSVWTGYAVLTLG